MVSLRNLIFNRQVGNASFSNGRREPYRLKMLFRKRNNTEWETWTDFHKKYQSDVYRKSANNQYREYTSTGPSKKVSIGDVESGFFTKMVKDSMKDSTHAPKAAAQRRGSLGGTQHQRRRRSMAF